MELKLRLDGALKAWAEQQTNPEQAVLTVLEAHVAGPTTPFEQAALLLKEKVKTMPPGFEFEIQQVIGHDTWKNLSRETRLSLGRHVKASQDAFGVEFIRKSSSNHAIYRAVEEKA